MKNLIIQYGHAIIQNILCQFEVSNRLGESIFHISNSKPAENTTPHIKYFNIVKCII
jgi:hypothetical protein